ncbi:MAG: methyltransferase domain-containing protein [Chloroflexi bacterium]|nr:methyltransferase domain-containing protein [Chloroflexota bacterium]
MSGPRLKKLFDGVDLHIQDLYLLEPFQIEYFPGWIPERELAAVLRAYPAIDRFLRTSAPAVAAFLDATKARYPASADRSDLAQSEDTVIWTIADLVVYNKCPEVYDRLEFHNWDFAEVTNITPLEGRVVVDVGSGTGRVALEAAAIATAVVAVEPVTRLRHFIRDKAAQAGRRNVRVVAGFGHAIPLPDGSADVLITSHALGWRLEDELTEFERVVAPAGHIIHCPGTAEIAAEEQQHRRLIEPAWNYRFARFREADGWKRKYWKNCRRLGQ